MIEGNSNKVNGNINGVFGHNSFVEGSGNLILSAKQVKMADQRIRDSFS